MSFNDTGYDASADDRRRAEAFSGSSYDETLRHADNHYGNDSDRSLFSNALSHLQDNAGGYQNAEIDEGKMMSNHGNMYGGAGGSHDSQSMGMGAAMQALKMFTQDGKGSGMGGTESGRNEFVGMAMAEAGKLFDQKNNEGSTAPSAEKQDVIKHAAESAMKMYMKSQLSGGSGGGASGLLSMASKFM